MKYIYSLLIIFSVNINTAIVIYTTSYIDVINKSVKENYSLIIEDKKIKSIEKGFIDISQSDYLIDLRGKTVMPGLMDMHVHFGQEYL